MNVNNSTPPGTEHYRSLQILDELSNNDSLTQRDLSSRLGIALGLVNSYIKNLVKKGFITVKTIPSKRYAYYLTPKGFTEKTRLTFDLLQDYTRIYREAKNNYRKLFHELEKTGIKNILFAGVDEVAEFAYITLQETGIRLVGVVDNDKIGEKFFGMDIKPMSDITTMQYECVVLTSHVKRDKVYKNLMDTGIEKNKVKTIF
jgi:DNA-binding MarR family transcriptional regulator